MSRQQIPSLARLALAAGLVFGAFAAHAAGGYTVSRNEEALVVHGMSQSDVRQALGRPDREVKFHNEPGPTFTYHVKGIPELLFDVDFGVDGRVAEVGEVLGDAHDGPSGNR